MELFSKTKSVLELVSLPHFLYQFSRKISLTHYLINRPSCIAWLLLLLEILVNMCIVVTCCPVCGVMNFEINLIFLIMLFFYITKTSGQKCKYLKYKKSSQHKIKGIFYQFWRVFKCQKLSQTHMWIFNVGLYWQKWCWLSSLYSDFESSTYV